MLKTSLFSFISRLFFIRTISIQFIVSLLPIYIYVHTHIHTHIPADGRGYSILILEDYQYDMADISRSQMAFIVIARCCGWECVCALCNYLMDAKLDECLIFSHFTSYGTYAPEWVANPKPRRGGCGLLL